MRSMPEKSVHTCVTSPPYWGLRDYGVDGQIGLEETPEAYVERMVAVFREVRRVLHDDGTLWLNLGDSYNNRTKVRASSHQPALNGFVDDNWSERAKRGGVRMSNMPGLKEKDLVGIPWMVAFALRADGWYLRSDIIWNKPNPMPESVRDRPTKAHEYIFLLTKRDRYYYDHEAIKEPSVDATNHRPNKRGFKGKWDGKQGYSFRHTTDMRNRRSVWTVTTKPFKGAHFATFPPELIEPCIIAGCPEGGTILDPFFGAGTTGLVAKHNARNYVGIELNPEYVKIAQERLA